MKRRTKIFLAVLGVLVVFAVIISLPPVWSHVGWRLEKVVAAVNTWLHPPQNLTFSPSGSSGTPTGALIPSPTSIPSQTLDFQATPTITPTPLPGQVLLQGVKFIHQHDKWNYCAPANMAMVLSYWGVNVSREAIAAVVKPFDEDKNVMPYELVDYVNQQTNLKALIRMGGDLPTLKNLLSNQFVVLVEKGVFFRDTLTQKTTWMGHYNVVVGYDDATGDIITMDSYIGTAEHPEWGTNLHIPQTEFVQQWRAFNYIFLVVYPPEKENDVLNAIGPLADETAAFHIAAATAEAETKNQSGLDLYMAWFNLGTSRVKLLDYVGAADAYDQAFRVYPQISEDQRPFRMLWYQTGPYFAYYYTGRYPDVISLANTTIASASSVNKPYIEESWYWRGMAELAMGDQSTAIDDLRRAIEYHPGFAPAVAELETLGVPLQ